MQNTDIASKLLLLKKRNPSVKQKLSDKMKIERYFLKINEKVSKTGIPNELKVKRFH